MLVALQLQGQIPLETFTDRAAFLAATGATSATGPLPLLGYVASAHVGSLTISNLSGNPDPSVALGFGESRWDLSPLLPGVDLSVGGFEDLNIALDNLTFSFGFDFAEHMTVPSEEGGLCGVGFCLDSVFTVSLFRGIAPIGSFEFNAPNDVASFVGVRSAAAFDRVEIREARAPGGGENDYFGQFYTGPNQPPPCILDVTPGYAPNTLTLGFALGTMSPQQWNVWLVSHAGLARLWSIPLPTINPPIPVPVPIPLTPRGTVGILTTLSASGPGILCSKWKTINTGGAGATREQLWSIVESSGVLSNSAGR
jgi:hypothetical protein